MESVNIRGCDLNIDNKYQKIKEEYLNEYGYNIQNKYFLKDSHYQSYSHSKENIIKKKPKI